MTLCVALKVSPNDGDVTNEVVGTFAMNSECSVNLAGYHIRVQDIEDLRGQ